jgi:hypothetical protein
MTTAITPIRIVAAVAALLALSAIGARAALAYPSADGADTQLRTNVLGSQLDRVQPDGYQPQLHDGYQSTAGDIYPDAFERAAIRLAGSDYPDVIERAALARQAEVAAQQANVVQSKPDGYQSAAGDIYPDAFERAAIRLAGSDYPDVIERAVLARQAEVAAQQANIVQSKPDGYQPQLHTQQPVSGGSDGSFDWNLFAMVLALGLAACGIAVLGIRHRERVAHP